jgi:hypothetical protein
MRNESQERGWSEPEDDARSQGWPVDPRDRRWSDRGQPWSEPSPQWDEPGQRGDAWVYGPRGDDQGYGQGGYGQGGHGQGGYGRQPWSDQPDASPSNRFGPGRANDDVPGYEWRDTGAATTTGRGVGRSGWRPDGRTRDTSRVWNQTSEPGPSRQWDERRPPEPTSGLDRPPTYEARDRADDRFGPGVDDDIAWRDRDARRWGREPRPFGDHRWGRPDEWSSQQSSWPNRPSRYEDANSGRGGPPSGGAGMGGGMYWSGVSAREDDEMRGHLPTGRQIPTRDSLAEDAGEMRTSYAGRGPRGYRRSDQRIAEDVSDRLTDDEYLDASDLEVTIQDGVVVLEGAVDTRASRRRAEDIAESVSGVRDVMNRLSVREST